MTIPPIAEPANGSLLSYVSGGKHVWVPAPSGGGGTVDPNATHLCYLETSSDLDAAQMLLPGSHYLPAPISSSSVGLPFSLMTGRDHILTSDPPPDTPTGVDGTNSLVTIQTLTMVDDTTATWTRAVHHHMTSGAMTYGPWAGPVPEGGNVGDVLTRTGPEVNSVAFSPLTHYATFSSTGVLSVKTGAARYYFDRDISIDTVRASVGTAPTGASLIVDVNKNGTTIYTAQAGRPMIPAGSNTFVALSPSVPNCVAGDYLTVDIDQVGSTVAGSDLTVQVHFSGAV